MSVRTPPRPPYERTPDACSLCGTPPPGRRRSWCSDQCVQTWWLATDAQTQLRHLVELHGQVCWGCGAREWYPPRDYVVRKQWSMRHFIGPIGPRPVKLEVEHRRPLWSLTPEERRELRWWLPFNLQLLCVSCHRAKTKREAGERAAGRRPAGEPVEPIPTLFDDGNMGTPEPAGHEDARVDAASCATLDC